MGTGEIALPGFEALVAGGFGVAGLVTQPDRPVGRHHSEPRPPRIKEHARRHGLPVLQPRRLRKKEAVAEVEALAPDLLLVMAYGQIIPREVYEMPPLGCINVHASLLPRHRGAACLQAAIDAGDGESGLTVMDVTEGLDTGDIISRWPVALAPDETAGSLHDRLAELEPEALRATVAAVAEGKAARTPQEEAWATYAPKLSRADGQLDWAWPASRVERRIRAYHPWPGTFTWMGDARRGPRRLKVFPGCRVEGGSGAPGTILRAGPESLVVACGDGSLVLGETQLDGGRRLAAREFLAGHRLQPGDRFFSLEAEQK